MMARSRERQKALLTARMSLLAAVEKDPGQFLEDQEIYNAVKSQNGLASYASRLFDIQPVSLNTLKRYAYENLYGGYRELEAARMRALGVLQAAMFKANSQAGSAGTKRSLERRLKEAIDEREGLREELVLLTSCLQRSLRLWRGYVSTSGSEAEVVRCRKEQAEILACFSHAKTAGGQIEVMDNVVEL